VQLRPMLVLPRRRGLPTRQAVTVGRPHPAAELVTIPAPPEPGSSWSAVPLACQRLDSALFLNGADNGLHLVSAAAGLAIALWPAQRTARGLADRSA
jgi:hypothetical protein